MKIQHALVVAALSLVALPSFSQEPAGKWNAWIETPQGKLPLVMDFDVNGSKLTGTFSNDFMPQIPIQDGTVEGNEISFKLMLQVVTLAYSGVIEEGELKLTSKVLESRPSPGRQTLGGVLQSVDVITATRAE